jgi:hypothetical protein
MTSSGYEPVTLQMGLITDDVIDFFLSYQTLPEEAC